MGDKLITIVLPDTRQLLSLDVFIQYEYWLEVAVKPLLPGEKDVPGLVIPPSHQGPGQQCGHS